jgi:hypothetical protein
MKRTKRYDEGGYADSEDSKYDMPAPKSSMAEATESAPEKKQSFKEAFAANRKAGAKTFEFNGKRYTTDLASGKPAEKPAPAAKPASMARVGETPYDTMNRRNREESAAKADIRGEANRLARRLGTGTHANGKPILAPEGYKKGGVTRADGIAQRGKTRGRIV